MTAVVITYVTIEPPTPTAPFYVRISWRYGNSAGAYNSIGLYLVETDGDLQLPAYISFDETIYNSIQIKIETVDCTSDPFFYTYTVAPSKTPISGTVHMDCNDNNCSQQGAISLVFTFDNPTPQPLTIWLGQITQSSGAGKRASGFEIFTIPPGVGADAYFSRPDTAFEVNIPSGVSSFTVPRVINQRPYPGYRAGAWVCHKCLFPVTDLYIKVANAPLLYANFRISGNPATIHNIV